MVFICNSIVQLALLACIEVRLYTVYSGIWRKKKSYWPYSKKVNSYVKYLKLKISIDNFLWYVSLEFNDKMICIYNIFDLLDN